MKKFISWFMVFIFMVSVPVMSNAQSLNDLKKKQQTINNNSSEAKKLLEETKNQKTSTLSEIQKIDEELDKVVTALDDITNELDMTNALLLQTEQELKQTEEKRQAQYEYLKSRIRYMYINGKVEYLDIILRSKSITDFFNRVMYITRIIKNDSDIIERIKATEEEISQKVNDTEKQKREVETLLLTQEQKKHSLEQTIKQKEQIMQQINADEQKYTQSMQDLEKSAKEIQDLIKKAEAAAAKSSQPAMIPAGGKLGWPVPGRGNTSDTFRYRKNPVTGKGELHDGLDIPAPMGTNIVAAEAGTVIFSGVKSGFGSTVVINHGGGITTLYGHNSKLVVSIGDKVTRGQVIAKCGSTGISTGPHCHFSVYVNGTAVDPWKYLK